MIETGGNRGPDGPVEPSVTPPRPAPTTGQLFEDPPAPVVPERDPARDPVEEASCYADVALNRPVRCEFTYRVPPDLKGLKGLDGELVPGMRVTVPFGSRREVGVVVAIKTESKVPAQRLRALTSVLDIEAVVDGELLELTRWMSNYYVCSWGEALAAVLPAPLKRESALRKVRMVEPSAGVDEKALEELEASFPKQHRLLRTLLEVGAPIELREIEKRLNLSSAPAQTLARKGLIRIERCEVAPDPLSTSKVVRERPETLSDEQQAAVTTMTDRLDEGGFRTYLLQGVTGSGKTEVYLRVIERALEMGKGAIVLVPEIALTPQTVGWFRSRFGEVAVAHSRMTDTQRLGMWMRVKRREARVVVGARSGVFAPVPDLGVIVVDEEHEPSFKQGNSPRYHGRDVAVMRARNAGALCILGSATPSMESWHNAREGRYELLELKHRVAGGRMPSIEVVDMRGEKAEAGQAPLFSRRLRVLLQEAHARKEQSILFLNRRGFSPVLWCLSCGETVRCTQCDVSLTFHRRIRRAVCHSCCEEIPPPSNCPSCTAPALRYLGLGSERVEDELHAVLPGASVRRMDSDTMVRREDYEETLDAFGRGEIDVLVGTQMIAKGLDFPRVTVVGIVSADSSLHLPDFRAAERTFQLLAQVSGRAGRGELAGRIVVQTITPEHPAIVRASRHDYEGFVTEEADLRRELDYPPYGRLVRVVIEDKEEQRVVEAAARLADLLRAEVTSKDVTVLGPAPAPIAILRGRHRHHILLKSPPGGLGFAHARSILLQQAELSTRPRLAIDVDPIGMI